MEEVEYKSNYGNKWIIIFVITSIILGLFAYYDGEWKFYQLYPVFYFIMPFIYYSLTKYTLNSEALEIKEPFSKKLIRLNKIKSVEVGKHNKWHGFFNGQPVNYVLLKYNKFDETYLYPESPEQFKEKLLQLL